MDVLTNALEIASRGFPVFPVRLCPDACLRAVYARRKRLRTAFTTRHRTRSKSGGIGRSRAYELMAIADGRTTLEKVRTSTNERQKIHKAKSQSVTNDDPDDAPIQEGINKKNPRVGYLLRADQAKRFAAYSGPVDREIVDYARAVATAWSNLARELEQKLAATNAGAQ